MGILKMKRLRHLANDGLRCYRLRLYVFEVEVRVMDFLRVEPQKPPWNQVEAP